MLWECYNTFKASFLLRSQGACPVRLRYLPEVTWERREELIRKEEREECRSETLRNMLAAGIDDEILRVAGFTTEEIEREKAQK